MKELQAIIAAAAELREAGRPALLATVVATAGSTYRLPGGRLLMDEDGWRAGSISGGCLEVDILATAWERTANGAVVVEYNTGEEGDAVFGYGTGCRGVVRVLLERLAPVEEEAGSLLAIIGDTLFKRRQPLAVATIIAGGRGMVGQRLAAVHGVKVHDTFSDPMLANQIFARMRDADLDRERAWLPSRQQGRCIAYEDGEVEIFHEFLRPPPALTIYGTGADVVPVVQLAKALGWHTSVGGPRPERSAKRFHEADRVVFGPRSSIGERLRPEPGGAVLLMTHTYLADMALLESLVWQDVSYLGILGPRERRERLLRDLALQMGAPIPPERLARCFAPAGLDLGGEGPEHIALSVVTEIQAVLAEATCGHLRDRSGPIHPREPVKADGWQSPSAMFSAPMQVVRVEENRDRSP